MRACAIAAIVCAVRSVAADVRAEDAAKAAALFEDGRKMIGESKIDAACDRFEASLALDPSIGTRLNLADCRERQGKLAVAYELFRAALIEATASGKEGRAKFARQHADALAAKLVTVNVRVTEPELAGLAIKVAGRELRTIRASDEIVVEPGAIAIDATAPDHAPFHAEQVGVAGGKLAFEVPALAAVAKPEPAAPEVATSRSIAPTILLGAGGGLLAASLGVAFHAKSRYDTAAAKHPPDTATVKSAQHEADIATGIAIAGGVALGIGAMLYLRERDHVVVLPTGPGVAGVTISGPF